MAVFIENVFYEEVLEQYRVMLFEGRGLREGRKIPETHWKTILIFFSGKTER